jgi:transposase-like protein
VRNGGVEEWIFLRSRVIPLALLLASCPIGPCQDRATYNVHPNNILNWRKQLLEGGARLFQIKRTDIPTKAGKRKAAALEAKIMQKDEVIAELAEEPLMLKKSTLARDRHGERPKGRYGVLKN